MAGQKGLILLGHGARTPAWARPMQAMQQELASLAPDLPVSLAFLEFISPDLTEAAADLCEQGVNHITIAPVFLAQSGHLKRDLPVLLQAVEAAQPGCTFVLESALGEDPAVIKAFARAALSRV